MWATTFLSLSIAHINSSSIKSWPSPGNTRDTTHSIPTSINTTSKQSKIPFTSPSKNHLYSPEQNRSTTQIMSTSFPPANNTTPPNYSIQAIPTAFIFSLLPQLAALRPLLLSHPSLGGVGHNCRLAFCGRHGSELRDMVQPVRHHSIIGLRGWSRAIRNTCRERES